mgnify:CR=1 FL=1
MEGCGADSSDQDYGDINSGGGFSSSDTKSRYQGGYMSTRSQSVLNAPESTYVAVPVQFNTDASKFVEHSGKYVEIPTNAVRDDSVGFMTGEEAVNKVASLVDTGPDTKAVVLPYATNYFDDKRADFIDKDIGDGCSFIAELESGEDATKAGVDKEEEKLPSKRVPRRTSKKKTITPAPVVDKDYFTKEYKRTVVSYWAASYNQRDVLEYLNIGHAKEKRGCSYIKFVRTLYLLGNEYLSPEEFAKSDGKLYRWEVNVKMGQSNYGGMGELALSVGRTKDPKEDDWHLADGVSLTMYLWDSPDYNKKQSWNPWVAVRKSAINNTGNGLFAAREFQKGETVGFYVGNVVYKDTKKWTGKASEEFLREREGCLEDDRRTMTLVDKEGFRVMVNPCYGRNREKIAHPPLLMGTHFLNDFTKIYDEETGKSSKEKMLKHNNVWVDDQGGIKATKRILVGKELYLSYGGKRASYVDRKPKARATAKAKGTGTTTTAETIGVANVARRRGTVDSNVAQQNLGEQKFEEGSRKKKK